MRYTATHDSLGHLNVPPCRREPADFEGLEIVYLLDACPELGLALGECGTIVHAMRKPESAYLVEFVDPETGWTRAEEFFTPGQISRTPPIP